MRKTIARYYKQRADPLLRSELRTRLRFAFGAAFEDMEFAARARRAATCRLLVGFRHWDWSG